MFPIGIKSKRPVSRRPTYVVQQTNKQTNWMYVRCFVVLCFFYVSSTTTKLLLIDYLLNYNSDISGYYHFNLLRFQNVITIWKHLHSLHRKDNGELWRGGPNPWGNGWLWTTTYLRFQGDYNSEVLSFTIYFSWKRYNNDIQLLVVHLPVKPAVVRSNREQTAYTTSVHQSVGGQNWRKTLLLFGISDF